MNFSGRYNYIMLITFALVALVSLVLFVSQLKVQYDDHIRLIKDAFSARALTLDHVLQGTTDHVDTMRTRAEAFFKIDAAQLSNGVMQFRVLQELEASGPTTEPAPGGSGSTAAGAPGQELYQIAVRPPYTSTILGHGGLRDRSPEFYRDMAMSLQLNPLFASAKRTIPNAAWVYYTADEHFINIYPWPPDASFRETLYTKTFTDTLYKEQFYKDGLPTLNPERKAFWTEAYIDVAGKGLMVTYAAPVDDTEHTFRGTVAIDLTLDALNRYVQPLDVDYTTTLLIINEQDTLLAHPTLVNSKDQVVKKKAVAFDQAIQSRIDQLLQSQPMQVSYVDDYAVLYQDLQQAPWKLVFVARRSAIIGSLLAQTGWLEAILLLGLIITPAIANILTRREFIRPAHQLVEHIANESKNRVTAIPPVPPAWQPWFAEVSRIFQENRELLHQLHLREERLKQEVQELRIEIDQVKQAHQVAEITETEYFRQLRANARTMRERFKTGAPAAETTQEARTGE